MTGNEIGVEGAKAMSEMMKANTTLTSLDLRSEENKKKKVKKRKKRKKRRMNDRQ